MKQNFAERKNRLDVSEKHGFSGWQGEYRDGRYLCPGFLVPNVLNGRGMRPGKQSWHGPCPSSPLPNVNSYLTQGAVDKEQLSTGTAFRPTKNPSIYQDGVRACLRERELESRCGLAFKVTGIKRIHFHRVLTQA